MEPVFTQKLATRGRHNGQLTSTKYCGPGMNFLTYQSLTVNLKVVINALAAQFRSLKCFRLMCTSNVKDHLSKNISYEVEYCKLFSQTFCNPSASSLETKTLKHSM